MTATVGLAISGASGRMGQALIELARRDRRFALRRAVVGPASERIGAPVYPIGLQEPPSGDVLVYSAGWDGAAGIGAVVDFSTPEGLTHVLDFCLQNNVPLVTGTTGIGQAMLARLREAAGTIPLLSAANFSLGVAVLTQLLRKASAALPGWDLEIIEAHHGRKEDAPSGTALALGDAAAHARGTTLEETAIYVREGRIGPRDLGSIGFAVVRGGDIVGEHTAMLAGQGERIELTHRATDRSIFARGALEAAAWLATQKPGAYDLSDMLGTRG